jgi:GMP synthase (glutamine-hydrolysing)
MSSRGHVSGAAGRLGGVRVLAIVHEATAGPGVFADAITASGAQLDCWRVPEGGAPPGGLSAYDAVLTFGGAIHPDATEPWLEHERDVLAELLERRTPLFGVCLGAQLVAQAAGALARRAASAEIGWCPVTLRAAAQADPLMGTLPAAFEALEWHSYEFDLPAGAVALADSPVCLQAYRIGECAWGIQFHAEVRLADYERWLDDADSDADTVGLDREALRLQTRAQIEAWNVLGRELCERFLTEARARTAALRA